MAPPRTPGPAESDTVGAEPGPSNDAWEGAGVSRQVEPRKKKNKKPAQLEVRTEKGGVMVHWAKVKKGGDGWHLGQIRAGL